MVSYSSLDWFANRRVRESFDPSPMLCVNAFVVAKPRASIPVLLELFCRSTDATEEET